MYKRNQIEEATSRLLEPKERTPSSTLLTRIKRLMEVDRELGRSTRGNDPLQLNYAFFTDEPQGSGKEVSFSPYEAFAVFTSQRMLAHSWDQRVAVSMLRRIRPKLEAQHARILRQDPASLFDQAQVRKNAQAGDIAVDNTDPVFLVLAAPGNRPSDVDLGALPCSVERGAFAAFSWASDQGTAFGSIALFELATSAHRLVGELARTEPRLRGR